MAQWLIDHVGWLVLLVGLVLVGIKLVLGLVFRRLVEASEEDRT